MNSSAIWLQIPGEGVPFNLKLRRELPPIANAGEALLAERGERKGLGGWVAPLCLQGGECGWEHYSSPCHPTSICLEGEVQGLAVPWRISLALLGGGWT